MPIEPSSWAKSLSLHFSKIQDHWEENFITEFNCGAERPSLRWQEIFQRHFTNLSRIFKVIYILYSNAQTVIHIKKDPSWDSLLSSPTLGPSAISADSPRKKESNCKEKIFSVFSSHTEEHPMDLREKSRKIRLFCATQTPKIARQKRWDNVRLCNWSMRMNIWEIQQESSKFPPCFYEG